MRVYLIQHGEARSEIEDPQRSLTARGEEEVRRISKAAKGLNITPSMVYHSGKTRAKQTAEIIAGGLNISDLSVQGVHGLEPNDDVRPWVAKITKETEDIIIVGHLPFLDRLTSMLLCGNENARLVLFRYGAIVCLEQKEDKRWAIRWIFTPEIA